MFSHCLELTGDQECCSSDSYVWLVDNKYYTASILLKSSCTDDGGKISLVADNYEAVVILIDFTDVRLPIQLFQDGSCN